MHEPCNGQWTHRTMEPQSSQSQKLWVYQIAFTVQVCLMQAESTGRLQIHSLTSSSRRSRPEANLMTSRCNESGKHPRTPRRPPSKDGKMVASLKLFCRREDWSTDKNGKTAITCQARHGQWAILAIRWEAAGKVHADSMTHDAAICNHLAIDLKAGKSCNP